MSDLKIKKVTVAAKKTALKSRRALRTAGSREKEENICNSKEMRGFSTVFRNHKRYLHIVG